MSAYQRHELIDAILAQCTNTWSQLHGERHWRCVAWTGRRILETTSGADPLVVLLFALFHDSMREDDGADPEHGRRAGAFATALHGKAYTLLPEQLALLKEACDGHVDGFTSDDPTVGACWDADRLNLWRVGKQPAKRYLSTDAAKQDALIFETREVIQRTPAWEEVFAFYESL